MGHHRDDQVETVLMRLIRNHDGSFLSRQGIAPHISIPCCEDMKAIQLSPQYKSLADLMGGVQRSPLISGPPPIWATINRDKRVSLSDPRKIQVHRPLLSFDKSQLVDYCHTNQIPYIHDRTNDDPTFTLRNAVRHLRANHKLPRALDAPSILKLQSAAEAQAAALRSAGDRLFELIKVHSFDLRSGRMVIKILPKFEVLCEQYPEAGAHTLARLVAMVSPTSQENELSLVPERVFRAFLEILRRQEGSHVLNTQHVLLEMAERKGGRRDPDFAPCSASVNAPNATGEVSRNDQPSMWALYPEPPRKNDTRRTAKSFHFRQCSKERQGYSEAQQRGVWSDWLLWDWRYWVRIRVRNEEEARDVQIRHYRLDDVQRVRRLLKVTTGVTTLLSRAAPEKVRWSVPVLTMKGLVAVFPTLNIVVPCQETGFSVFHLEQNPVLEWEVCYRAFDYWMPETNLLTSDINTLRWARQ
jgi:tRNA(Ile)-lysidine synthase